MFLRTVKVKRPGGRVDEYIRLVESVWRAGRPEHRIVAHLGRKDLLAPHAATLLRMLTGDKASASDAAHVDAVGAWDWGPVLVARHLWRELGLEQTVDALARDRGALADRAVALVASRVCEPTSEHGMARWLETTYVCDRSGQRWWPAWRDEAERLASRRPRVRVKDRQLRQWYGTLDWLVRHKPQLEQELFVRLRTLFALNVDLVFYDLTSTYFEGNGPTGLAKHGHSRDGKPRNRQVLVGMVMIDGWPIAHHVFEGNRRDASTVTEVVSDLQARFGLRRVVFVGDRGMVTAPNVALLRAHEQGYVVGLNRRRRPKVLEYVRRATGPWLDCPLAISARERVAAPKTRVQEVPSDEPGVRVFVVHSEERLAYERGEREKAMLRVRTQLEALTVYKELSEVERAFAELKDVIEMRPIYHRKADRVRAHIFVASLAFLLDRALEKKLKSSDIDISSKEAWQLLKTVRVVEIDLGNGERKRSITRGSARAVRILNALGITDLDPDSAAAKATKAA